MKIRFSRLPVALFIMRSMALYSVLLLVLFSINFTFNIYSSWEGVNFVVKLYIYVYSFFLVYLISTSLPVELKEYYSQKGILIKFLYVVESRIFPFLLIYIITVIYYLIENMHSAHWPYDTYAGVFDDATSNLVVFSVALMYVMKIRKRPYITIPIFLISLYLFSIINTAFYDHFFAGTILIAFKVVKATMVFFLMTWSSRPKIARFIQNFIFSLVLAIVINVLVIAMYKLEYQVFNNAYAKSSVGLKMAKLGNKGALPFLVRRAFELHDIDLLDQLYPYLQVYKIAIEQPYDEWINFLFSSDMPTANRVASYMLKEGIGADSQIILNYVSKQYESQEKVNGDTESLIRLTAKSIDSPETIADLLTKMERSDKPFLIWGIKVLGETGDCALMHHLVIYVAHIDIDIAHAAYNSLKVLSGLDPYKKSKLPINSIETIKVYQDYLNNSCNVLE